MLKNLIAFILILYVVQASTTPKQKIHISAHTHDDVGWIVTLEEYYYGIKQDGVQYILDNTISELLKDPKRRFIYVEMAFFELWWSEQTEETKTQVRGLVKSGQLEFINAGWCMNDEAAAYYEDIVDQMTIGHEFVKKEFNIVPTIGWQIDPFGHSSAMAKLFHDMGFDAFYLTRIDYQDREQRKKDKSLELIWAPTAASGQCKSIFTYITPNNYESPPDCDFDDRSSFTPVIDNMDKPHLYNVDTKAKNLVNFFNDTMSLYQSKGEYYQMFGSDFHFRNARMSFKNMGKLISYVNSHPEFNTEIEYSTPSTYLAAVVSKNLTFPFKSDDFFPYADNENSYWTGYFSSRPIFKGSVRSSSRTLQALRTKFSILAFTTNDFSYPDSIYNLEKELGVCQHHDAVSGTATQHTTDDYTSRLATATALLVKDYTDFLDKVLNQDKIGVQTNFASCLEIEGNCEITRNADGDIIVSLYSGVDSRSAPVNIIVSRPKSGKNLQIVDMTNQTNIPTTVVCSNSTNTDSCILTFIANFESREVKFFKITHGSEDTLAQSRSVSASHSTEVQLSTSKKLVIDEDLQTLQIVEIKDGKAQTRTFKLTYNYYQSSASDDQSSGAYIFRPDDLTKDKPLIYSQSTKATVFEGTVLSQITFYSAHMETNLKFYKGYSDASLAGGFEIESHIGEIDIADGIGKEVVITIKEDSLDNAATFYTDANGLEFQKRVFNKRPTWDLDVKQRVAGNYYPVNSAIFIKSEASNLGFALLNDRAQGGSSIERGSVELMIHRRCLHDDSRGVGDHLNEVDANGKGISFRTRHILAFTANTDEIRQIQFLNDNPLVTAFSKLSSTKNVQPLSLPSIMKIPSFTKFYLRKLEKGFMVRFQNVLESKSSTVELPKNFKAKELTLTGTIDKKSKDESRIKWACPANSTTPNDTDSSLELLPLEIRTFKISNKKENSYQFKAFLGV